MYVNVKLTPMTSLRCVIPSMANESSSPWAWPTIEQCINVLDTDAMQCGKALTTHANIGMLIMHATQRPTFGLCVWACVCVLTIVTPTPSWCVTPTAVTVQEVIFHSTIIWR